MLAAWKTVDTQKNLSEDGH